MREMLTPRVPHEVPQSVTSAPKQRQAALWLMFTKAIASALIFLPGGSNCWFQMMNWLPVNLHPGLIVA